MKLPLKLAEKLWDLSLGEVLPASALKHKITDELIAEGIIKQTRYGRNKSDLSIPNELQLFLHLRNHFGIDDLAQYIEVLKKENVSRAELVNATSDSKLKAVRTFKGFLVNCYEPVQAQINNSESVIHPQTGTFTFVFDFESFIPAPEITIVGVENPENFRYIERQKYLFKDIKPLFVSRYPQNQCKDLMRWLMSLSNKYIHFGDFDFAGIGIYLNEFKPFLPYAQTRFFIPLDIDKLIQKSGSKKLYDIQKINFNVGNIAEEELLELIESIHRHKKGLEQEWFIK